MNRYFKVIIILSISLLAFFPITKYLDLRSPYNPENWFNEGFFARHETFCPRYGWLKKGFDAIKKYPDIFTRDDAIEILGVGKNMVRAIRFWCVAFKITKPIIKPATQIRDNHFVQQEKMLTTINPIKIAIRLVAM